MLDRGELYVGPNVVREVKLVACVIRGIQHQIEVSLANYGSLFVVCACVGTYVPGWKIACFVLISNMLGFTSFKFSSLLSREARSYNLEGIEQSMCAFQIEF